jgi:hypothetical protein
MLARRLTITSLAVASSFHAATVFAQPASNAWPDDPKTAADPPLIAPPQDAPPTSTSGSDVTPSTADAKAAAASAPDTTAANAAAANAARIRELETRVAIDEAKLKSLENGVSPLRNLKVQGYVQAQYVVESVNAAASPNLVGGRLPEGIGSNDVVAKADGTTTNLNRFRLRRTRLRTIYETDIVRVFLQLDFLPSGGPNPYDGSIMRNAEATGIARWSKDVRTELTAGLFMVPFRYENTEISLYRPFIERTWANLNIFPGERDIGAHAKTFAMDDRLQIDVGILNGGRLGTPTFVAAPDLNHGKDYFAMASYKLGPVTVNVNGYLGSAANVDPKGLRVKNYGRRGVNVGTQIAHTFAPSIGETRLYSELMFAENMDTGIRYPFAVPAIPASFTDDVRDLGERSFYVRVEQDLTQWALAGFRYDMYTTDTSIANNARDTYTFMAGARFTKYLRLVNELGWAIDNIHPEGSPPPSKEVFTETVWLQGSFY